MRLVKLTTIREKEKNVFFGLSKEKPADHIEEGFPILVRKENKQTHKQTMDLSPHK
jgi:hypothetical protein